MSRPDAALPGRAACRKVQALSMCGPDRRRRRLKDVAPIGYKKFLLTGAGNRYWRSNQATRRLALASNGGDMKRKYGLVVAIGLWHWAGAASAADTASASGEDQGTLAEIVVTAQKRAE